MRITSLALPLASTAASTAIQRDPVDSYQPGGLPPDMTSHKLRKLFQEPPTVRMVFGEAQLRERGDLTPVDCSGEELARRLEPTLRSHLREKTYNSFAPVLSFVETMQQNPPGANWQSWLEPFRKFQLDSRQETDSVGGSSCVGLAHDLCQTLRDQGYPAYCCPVRLPEALRQGNPFPFGHTAVVVPYREGFLLLDPGLSLPQPIPVEPDKPVRLTPWDNGPFSQDWEFSYQPGDPPSVRCLVTIPNSEGGGESTFFPTLEWTNADQTLARCTPFNPRPRITARDEHGHPICQVAVETKKDRVLVMIESEGRRKRVPVAEAGDSLDDAMARKLLPQSDSPRRELLEMVGRIAEAMPVLGRAKTEFLDSLRPH